MSAPLFIRTTILAATLAAAASVTTAASAADNGRERQIDATQAREAAAIEQGRYNGSLTRREYRDLLAEQARIAELERKAKADGHVSRREFSEIREAQANAARHIQAESTDSQRTFWRTWLYRNRY